MKPYEWLNEDARTYLSRGYCRPGQTAEERIQEIADHAERILGAHFFPKEKFLDYMARGFYSLSSPVWANFGAGRGLPCSCNGSYIPDSLAGIFTKVAEVGMMTKHGAGTSAYFGDIRAQGSPIGDGGKASGPVSFMELYESVIRTTSQAGVRRGNFVASLPIDHPDIMDFLELREEHSRVQDLSLGVCVSDDFMRRLEARDQQAMTVWARVIKKRYESGYPYIFFSDTVNRYKPSWYADRTILASNLCQEICLPFNVLESFVCCLSSINVAEWDELKHTDAIEVLLIFLDAVISDYIRLTADIPYMEAARNFAANHRAIGLGVLGWHTLLQRKSIPFASFDAMQLNAEIFKTLDERTRKASSSLADQFGECPVTQFTGQRNATRLAIAPTTSSSFILGQVSPGIEPHQGNYYVKDLAKGKFTYKNPEFLKLLDELGQNTDEVLYSVLVHGGSVQHLDFLTDHQKEVFLTAGEISQLAIIQQAAQRQRWIDQSQSLNLFIHPSTPPREVNALLFEAWKLGVKTLYYQRGTNPAQELGQNLLSCKACEG